MSNTGEDDHITETSRASRVHDMETYLYRLTSNPITNQVEVGFVIVVLQSALECIYSTHQTGRAGAWE
jgi:hypothetical protein